MGHKKQVRRFIAVLYFCALTLFTLAMITKLFSLTIFGYACLLGGFCLQYFYLPQLKKEKKEKKIVLEEVHADEVFDLTDKIKIYWDKFIVWLHT